MAKLKGMHHKKLESVQLDVSGRLCRCTCGWVGVFVMYLSLYLTNTVMLVSHPTPRPPQNDMLADDLEHYSEQNQKLHRECETQAVELDSLREQVAAAEAKVHRTPPSISAHV